MIRNTMKFRDYPFTVRYGISLTIATWILFIVSIAMATGTISIFHISMGMFVCFSVLSLRRWSRIFTAVYNLGMSLLIGREIYFMFIDGRLEFSISVPLKIVCVILFAVTSLLLLAGQSKQFFRDHAG